MAKTKIVITSIDNVKNTCVAQNDTELQAYEYAIRYSAGGWVTMTNDSGKVVNIHVSHIIMYSTEPLTTTTAPVVTSPTPVPTPSPTPSPVVNVGVSVL